MNVVYINPQMKVAEVNRIALEQGCRVRLIKLSHHMRCAFTASDSGRHDVALEHLRAASSMIDEAEGSMPCSS